MSHRGRDWKSLHGLLRINGSRTKVEQFGGESHPLTRIEVHGRGIGSHLVIREFQQPQIVFGDLLRGVRQQLLADGYPGVLGVVAFGDADWIFGNAPA